MFSSSSIVSLFQTSFSAKMVDFFLEYNKTQKDRKPYIQILIDIIL